MNRDFLEGDLPCEESIARFAARLEQYAATLPPRERRSLETILLRAMDPLERIAWRDTAELLDPREEALLRSLTEER
jgi:hypothetical protein